MALAFIDANAVVYMYGRPHPYQEPCESVLRFAASRPTNFGTSAEVLQELLNLGLRRGALELANQMMRTLANSCGEVVSVLGDDVFRALAYEQPRLSARDRIHLAVMERLGITHIISTDRAFDTVPGITRLDPLDFASWSDQFAEDD
jgi:hypothetical protein